MKSFIAAAMSVLVLSTPAVAHDSLLSGAWRLSAKVASVPFNLICNFEQMGDQLGGTCAAPSSNKTLALRAGHIEGEHVTFKHDGHFLLNKFDVNYTGVVDGDKMTGQIAVFGHTGDFVAVREGS